MAKPCYFGSNKQTEKALLNQFAQKLKRDGPTYEAGQLPNGLHISTVTFLGKQYKSMNGYRKLKDAEQDAARVAMETLKKEKEEKELSKKIIEEEKLKGRTTNASEKCKRKK